MRHRVTIEAPVDGVNEFGERVVTWSTVETVYAAVEPVRGREFFAAEQVQSEVSHRVVMRVSISQSSLGRFTPTPPPITPAPSGVSIPQSSLGRFTP